MFCTKCGNKLSDDAAFCPKCGAPASQAQQPTGNITPTPPPTSACVTEANGSEVSQKGMLDKRKIALRIVKESIMGFVTAIIVSMMMAFGLWLMFGGFSLQEIIKYSGYAIFSTGVFAALLSAIKQVVIIILQVRDSSDATYEIGFMQNEETDKQFKEKYEKFDRIAYIVILAVEIVFLIASFIFFNYDGLKTASDNYTDENSGTITNKSIGTIAESGSVGNSDAGIKELLSSITYFVANNNENPSVIILEPDGSCAYLGAYTTRSIYYYGNYQQTEERIDLHLDSENGRCDIPLVYANGSLIYTGTESLLLFYPGAVYLQSEEPPESVQFNPPHSEQKAVSSTTYYQASDTVGEIDRSAADIPTLILESDNTCALLATFDGRPTYLYGTYEIMSTGVKLRLTDTDGSIFYISTNKAANGLDFPGGYSRLGLFPSGERLFQVDEVPNSVRIYPPYSGATGNATSKAVSETTYYYLDANYDLSYTEVLILNPDNTCAYLENIGEGMSYLDGQYKMSSDGVTVYLKRPVYTEDKFEDQTITILMEETGDDLKCASSTDVIPRQGDMFIRSDGLPISLALANLVSFLYELPDELKPPAPLYGIGPWIRPNYEETIMIDDQAYYLFQEDNFDQENGDRMAVNAQTGELLGIRIEGNIAYTMPLDEWLNGYFILGIDPWNE